MEAIETKKVGKYKIEIIPDEHSDSPDDWGNDDAFVVYDHPRYFDVKRKGFDPRDIFEHIRKTGRKFYNGYHAFVLYAYIHSGISLSVESHNFPDARWDVSSTGYVLVKREKGWSYRKNKALEVAQAITKEWNQYLSGDVYGFRITDAETEEVLDSCWGFYGQEECLKEAEGIVDYYIKKDKDAIVVV